MFKKTINFVNFNDEPDSETVYFNLTKTELIELEVGFGNTGMYDYLTKIMNSNDSREILDTFKTIVKASYGKKSADGRRFVKNDEVWEEFTQSPIYDQFFIELMTDPEASGTFVAGIMPKDLDKTVETMKQNSDQFEAKSAELKAQLEVAKPVIPVTGAVVPTTGVAVPTADPTATPPPFNPGS
jgi:hypothetical protein